MTILILCKCCKSAFPKIIDDDGSLITECDNCSFPPIDNILKTNKGENNASS